MELGREDRWDQWEAWWGEKFNELIAAVKAGQEAATPRPLADWPLAQANLPAAGEYPDYMQGTAPEGTDGYLLVNPTGSTIGVWLYAGTPSEGLGRIALIAPPGSMRSIPYGGRGWRVDGSLTIRGTGGAPVARLLAIHGPVQSGEGTDTVSLAGSLPAGTAAIGSVIATPQTTSNVSTTDPITKVAPSYYVGGGQFSPANMAYVANDSSNGLNIPVDAPYFYNESSWDRVRNNTQGTLLASAARTATASSPTMTNYNAKGVVISVNVTAVAGTSPTLHVVINAISPVSGTKIPILSASTDIAAIGEYAYQVYPGAAGYTQSEGAALPRMWEVDYVIGGTSPSFTFSSGYALIN